MRRKKMKTWAVDQNEIIQIDRIDLVDLDPILLESGFLK